jgi:hypothetical protein
MNCLSKSGDAKTGVEDIAAFKVSNAYCASIYQADCFFLRRLVRGFDIEP